MKSLKLEGRAGTCDIVVGQPISEIGNRITAERTAIVTDSNVRRYHEGKFPEAEVIEIGLGEKIKTLDTVNSIYEKFLAMELDRSCLVLGIGGGIVCDIAGFAATTYLRGVELAFVPTTVLAQVDASIGGKNGVNFKGYKNIIGTIRQPEFVLCDTQLLKTLPGQEVRNGFAEVVKQAAIGDGALFSYLEENSGAALKLEKEAMEKIVLDSIAVKVKIVKADETEKLERMKLNFGHTLGHAVEKVLGIPHGEAISIGMIAESRISVKRGLMSAADAEKLEKLLESIGLPTTIKADKEGVIDAIRKDKKRRGQTMKMPVLEGIGKSKIVDIGLEELEGAVDDMY